MDKRLIDAEKLLTDLRDKKKSLRESLNFAKREGETKWADELREQMQILTLIIDGVERGGYDPDPIPLPTIKPGDTVRHEERGEGVVKEVYGDEIIADYGDVRIGCNKSKLEVSHD
ncbi:hypothetical protein D3C74_218380 [compost metagenome]